MVEKYNAHIRGVDLCYMLLALYRIRLRTCKYYMHMVYYCMGISITNGWLLYQRYCELKHGSKKRPNGFVSISIERCKCSSGQQGKGYPQARPPFIIIIIHPQWSFSRQERYSAAFFIPVEDIRFDRVGHFPVFTKKQNRCRFSPRGNSHIRCRK